MNNQLSIAYYIASSFENREACRGLRERLNEGLEANGIAPKCTARWLDTTCTRAEGERTREQRVVAAFECYSDVLGAEALIFVDSPRLVRGGLVEVGIAIGRGAPIFWNDQRGEQGRNVFAELAGARGDDDRALMFLGHVAELLSHGRVPGSVVEVWSSAQLSDLRFRGASA